MRHALASMMLAASLVLSNGASAQTTTDPQGLPAPRDVSWKTLASNIAVDQGRIWSFPVRLAKGHAVVPTVAVLATTAALVALDPTEASYFHRTSSFHQFNNVFTSQVTEVGTIAAPLALYAVGFIHHDSEMEKTALFAGEAVADTEILATVLKSATKRLRPAGFPADGNLYDSWFDSGGSFWRGNGSFPSGHTIAAFAVATVIARRYRSRRWVPYAAYGAAALVAFSRLSLSSHFASDVFMGGALGYSISRFIVLRD